MPTVNIAPYVRNQYFTDNGIPLAGGLLNCYNGGSAGGTGDRKDTYSDAAGTVLNANPIVLDAAGRAKIYLKSGPYLLVLTDSLGSVIWSEDGVTSASVTSSVNVMTDLRALAGGSASIIRTLGRLTVNDGGGWWYYWNATSALADDGGMVIQPNSLPELGRWIGFFPENRELNLRVYGAVCDGTTDDSAALTLCNEYCSDNGCIMVIDSSTYEATNVSFLDDTGANLTPIKLLPNAQFRYNEAGTFHPVLNLIIGSTDRTRHFNCTASWTPSLSLKFLYPEWFGETETSHPITTAVIQSANPTKIRYLSEVEAAGTLYSRNGMRCTSGGVHVGAPSGSYAGDGLNTESIRCTGNVLVEGMLQLTSSPPATASSSGSAGQVAVDANYIYVCTATNTWKRAAISTWS